MTKIVIVVEGGTVQEVYSTEKDVEIEVLDFDEFDDSETNRLGLTEEEVMKKLDAIEKELFTNY